MKKDVYLVSARARVGGDEREDEGAQWEIRRGHCLLPQRGHVHARGRPQHTQRPDELSCTSSQSKQVCEEATWREIGAGKK